MKGVVISTLILMYSCFINAEQVTQSNLKVVKVMAGYKNNSVYFFVDKTPVNPSSCKYPKSGYNILAVDPGKSDISQVLSVLLTAQTAKSNVEIQVYDDDYAGEHAVIRRVAVH